MSKPKFTSWHTIQHRGRTSCGAVQLTPEQLANPVRWYDDKRRKRYVTVKVMRYWGYGNHYYVAIEEDDNPVAVPDEQGKIWWTEASNDPACRGKKFQKKFDFRDAAQRWIADIITEHFPTHKVVWERSNVEQQYFYGSGD